MEETVGKIELQDKLISVPQNMLISTPQICWMFDPDGTLLIETAENGYILRTFNNEGEGYKIALPPRFVEVKDIGITDVDWVGVRYLLFEILNDLELWGSKHQNTHLDIAVLDNKGKRIDDDRGDEDED